MVTIVVTDRQMYQNRNVEVNNQNVINIVRNSQIALRMVNEMAEWGLGDRRSPNIKSRGSPSPKW